MISCFSVFLTYCNVLWTGLVCKTSHNLNTHFTYSYLSIYFTLETSFIKFKINVCLARIVFLFYKFMHFQSFPFLNIFNILSGARMSNIARRHSPPSRRDRDRDRDGRRDDRRDRYRERERYSPPSRKRSRSPRRTSRSPPRRRSRTVPRYTVQIPKISLDLWVNKFSKYLF